MLNSNIANSKNELYSLAWSQEVEKFHRELLHASCKVLYTVQQEGEDSLNLLEVGLNLLCDLPHPDAALDPGTSE